MLDSVPRKDHHVKMARLRDHDARTSIAICPTCHYHAHHGELKIDQRSSQLEKDTRRPSNTGHLYIDPVSRDLDRNTLFRPERVEIALSSSTCLKDKVSFRILPGSLMMASA